MGMGMGMWVWMSDDSDQCGAWRKRSKETTGTEHSTRTINCKKHVSHVSLVHDVRIVVHAAKKDATKFQKIDSLKKNPKML